MVSGAIAKSHSLRRVPRLTMRLFLIAWAVAGVAAVLDDSPTMLRIALAGDDGAGNSNSHVFKKGGRPTLTLVPVTLFAFPRPLFTRRLIYHAWFAL